MTVHCHRCGTGNVRPAHFRWMDLGYLLALCFPVRCRYCRLRFYVSIFRIRRIGREAEARRARGSKTGALIGEIVSAPRLGEADRRSLFPAR